MGTKVAPRSFGAIAEPGAKSCEGREITPLDAGLAEGCLNSLQVGDTFFTLICTDPLMAGTIRYWAMIAREAGVPNHKIQGALNRAKQIEQWQKEHPERVKLPD